MGDVAAAVLAAADEQEKLQPSIQVEKAIPLEFDVGNMLAIDDNQIDNEKLEDPSTRDDYLLQLARDNTQLLINSIFTLPTQRVEEVVVATFPPPTFRLPREKPLPSPKEMTKWEKYAKEKGIVKKKKKDRLAWDDTLNQWVPQYGYKKKKAEDEKNWCIPIKESADPNLTPHEKMEEDKKERKAKNELQRLRNLARNKNLPTVGVVTQTNTKTNTSDDLKKAAEIAKESTASLGKFQPNLHKNLEKSAKTKSKKRKFESNTMDAKLERERNMGILDSLTNKQPRLDITAAVGKSIHQEETERSEEKKTSKSGKKGGKKKGGKKGGSFRGKGKGGKSFGGGGKGGMKGSSSFGGGGSGGRGGGRGGKRGGKSRGGKR